jgi:hypothetical protein
LPARRHILSLYDELCRPFSEATTSNIVTLPVGPRSMKHYYQLDDRTGGVRKDCDPGQNLYDNVRIAEDCTNRKE